MTERDIPNPSPTRLLDMALEMKRSEEARKQSVEEAKKHSPALVARIEQLIDFKDPEKSAPEDPDNPSFIRDGERMVLTDEGSKRLDERIRRSGEWRGGASINKDFLVPINPEAAIAVTLSRTKRSATINLHDLASLFVIDLYSGNAHVESKEHRHRTFDMHTPMGSSSDLGPAWSREATMYDVIAHSELLDTLEMLETGQ